MEKLTWRYPWWSIPWACPGGWAADALCWGQAGWCVTSLGTFSFPGKDRPYYFNRPD